MQSMFREDEWFEGVESLIGVLQDPHHDRFYRSTWHHQPCGSRTAQSTLGYIPSYQGLFWDRRFPTWTAKRSIRCSMTPIPTSLFLHSPSLPASCLSFPYSWKHHTGMHSYPTRSMSSYRMANDHADNHTSPPDSLLPPHLNAAQGFNQNRSPSSSNFNMPKQDLDRYEHQSLPSFPVNGFDASTDVQVPQVKSLAPSSPVPRLIWHFETTSLSTLCKAIDRRRLRTCSHLSAIAPKQKTKKMYR